MWFLLSVRAVCSRFSTTFTAALVLASETLKNSPLYFPSYSIALFSGKDVRTCVHDHLFITRPPDVVLSLSCIRGPFVYRFTLHSQLLLSLIKGSFKNENHRTHAGTPKSSKPLLFCECPLPFHRHSANLQTGKHFTSLVDFSTSFDKCFRGPLLHAILFLKTIVAAQACILSMGKHTGCIWTRDSLWIVAGLHCLYRCEVSRKSVLQWDESWTKGVSAVSPEGNAFLGFFMKH